MTVPEASVDLRVDGKHRVVMQAVAGGCHVAYSEFWEVRRPEKQVMTCFWKGTDPNETLLLAELKTQCDSTELILSHEEFATTDCFTFDRFHRR